jgi:hypothetical protein
MRGFSGALGNYYYGPDSHPRAIAAFGVGHIPLPFLDIYAKGRRAAAYECEWLRRTGLSA